MHKKQAVKSTPFLEDDHVGAQPFDGISVLDQAGEPHAASGLLQLSAAVLSLGQKRGWTESYPGACGCTG